MKRFVTLASMLAVACVGLAVGCGSADEQAQVAKQNAAAEKVIRAFQKTDSALVIGIAFVDYGKRLQDAQYALDIYDPSDSTGESIHSSLSTAMDGYKIAHDAWDAEMQGTFTGKKTSADYWAEQEPLLTNDLELGTKVEPDDIRQAGWSIAQEYIAKAKRLAKSYGATE